MTRPLSRCLPFILLLFFALPAFSQPILANWYWQNPLPQGNDLRGVWGASASDVYAIGGDQTLLHWDSRDEGGRRQASGVYFASLRTEFGQEVQKVTLVKSPHTRKGPPGGPSRIRNPHFLLVPADHPD